jgi:hypothetical protein
MNDARHASEAREADPELTALLERHAALAVAADPAAAALAAGATAEAAALLRTAERAFAALAPVPPEPAFRAALGRELARPRRSRRALHARPAAWRATWPAQPGSGRQRAMLTRGAAVVALGVAVAWLASRAPRGPIA